MIPTDHSDISSCPGCSISDSSPCSWALTAAKDDLVLGPLLAVWETQKELLIPGVIWSSLGYYIHLGNERVNRSSLSLSFSLSVSLILFEINSENVKKRYCIYKRVPQKACGSIPLRNVTYSYILAHQGSNYCFKYATKLKILNIYIFIHVNISVYIFPSFLTSFKQFIYLKDGYREREREIFSPLVHSSNVVTTKLG